MAMTGLISIDPDSLFSQFFISGGPIVWFSLLPMSVVMLYFGIDLLFRLRRKILLPSGCATEIATLAGRHGISGLSARLADSEDLISRSVVWAIGKTRKKGFEPTLFRQFASDCLRDQGMRLLRRAEGCHLIGTVAPLVGLFGTVFGMIKAFTVLGSAGGQPRPDQLAAAISVALVTTFWGLLVAIPALFLHGFFRTRIEGLVSEAALELEALLERLVEIGRLGSRVPFGSDASLHTSEQDALIRSRITGRNDRGEPEGQPLEMESGAAE